METPGQFLAEINSLISKFQNDPVALPKFGCCGDLGAGIGYVDQLGRNASTIGEKDDGLR